MASMKGSINTLDLTLLAQAKLPFKFWWDAFYIVVYHINRLSSTVLKHLPPMGVGNESGNHIPHSKNRWGLWIEIHTHSLKYVSKHKSGKNPFSSLSLK